METCECVDNWVVDELYKHGLDHNCNKKPREPEPKCLKGRHWNMDACKCFIDNDKMCDKTCPFGKELHPIYNCFCEDYSVIDDLYQHGLTDNCKRPIYCALERCPDGSKRDPFTCHCEGYDYSNDLTFAFGDFGDDFMYGIDGANIPMAALFAILSSILVLF